MPDLYSTFTNITDKGAVLKPSLEALLVKLLADGNMTEEQNGKAAKLLASIRIEL